MTEHIDQDNRLAAMLRITALIVLTAAAFGYSACRLAQTPYDHPPARQRTVDVQRRVVETYTKQNESLTNWSLTILGAIIAISVTSKVHHVRWCSSAYIVLGPAGAFFFGSLRAGWHFQRRVANMIALNDLSDLKSLASLLLQQTDLFRVGLIIAAAFGSWFLLNIVWGKTPPYEEPTMGDKL